MAQIVGHNDLFLARAYGMHWIRRWVRAGKLPGGDHLILEGASSQRRPPDLADWIAMPREKKAQRPIDYDAELQRHNEVLRRAIDVQPHHKVLDIGCGSGQTTRQAARTAERGSALGVDVSPAAIARARQTALAEGLRNVTFEHADAQAYGFPAEHFDQAISRFGTMFFADPVVAFMNIGRALREGGRLVMVVWQAHERNEWAVAIRESLTAAGPPVGGVCELPAFSLGDPQVMEEIMHAAGYVDVGIADVDEPVYYGPDVATALAWTLGFTTTQEILKGLDPDAETLAVQRLHDELSAHMGDDGIWLNSRAWLVDARRR